MPAYNGERFIAAALGSVRDQNSRDDIELVVVDDGSSDRTLAIIRDFANTLSIRLITPARKGNWVAVTNIGLREAQGEWACFLHQDDLWLPGRLAKVRSETARTEGAMLLHNSIFIGPDGKALGSWTCPLPEGNVVSEQFIEHVLIQNFIAACSPVFRRRAALDSGGLDESLWFTADWDLWLRLGAMGPVRFLPDHLTAFRVHSESQTTSREIGPDEWGTQLTTVLDRHLPHWPAKGFRRDAVRRVALASVSVNSTFAAASRGERVQLAPVLIQLLGLGPFGWHRYLRDSRITQRLIARLRLRYQNGDAV